MAVFGEFSVETMEKSMKTGIANHNPWAEFDKQHMGYVTNQHGVTTTPTIQVARGLEVIGMQHAL